MKRAVFWWTVAAIVTAQLIVWAFNKVIAK